MQPTEYKHIVLDENGLATIEGTRTKVFQILAEHYFHGWTPEEIHWQHPYLGLSQGKTYRMICELTPTGELRVEEETGNSRPTAFTANANLLTRLP